MEFQDSRFLVTGGSGTDGVFEHKRVEKLRYIHRNPVKRGLVESPEQWAWSSFRAYAYREKGLVGVNFQEWIGEDQDDETRGIWGDVGSILTPLNRKVRD